MRTKVAGLVQMEQVLLFFLTCPVPAVVHDRNDRIPDEM